ncbi:unnamed protein product [Amoebophrya sp. A120]|nr:unnamed protein product [Amoebophrya sp. A120]|eukprot:GSA120T00008034001.1
MIRAVAGQVSAAGEMHFARTPPKPAKMQSSSQNERKNKKTSSGGNKMHSARGQHQPGMNKFNPASNCSTAAPTPTDPFQTNCLLSGRGSGETNLPASVSPTPHTMAAPKENYDHPNTRILNQQPGSGTTRSRGMTNNKTPRSGSGTPRNVRALVPDELVNHLLMLEKERRLNEASHQAQIRDLQLQEQERGRSLNRAQRELDREINATSKEVRRQDAHALKVRHDLEVLERTREAKIPIKQKIEQKFERQMEELVHKHERTEQKYANQVARVAELRGRLKYLQYCREKLNGEGVVLNSNLVLTTENGTAVVPPLTPEDMMHLENEANEMRSQIQQQDEENLTLLKENAELKLELVQLKQRIADLEGELMQMKMKNEASTVQDILPGTLSHRSARSSIDIRGGSTRGSQATGRALKTGRTTEMQTSFIRKTTSKGSEEGEQQDAAEEAINSGTILEDAPAAVPNNEDLANLGAVLEDLDKDAPMTEDQMRQDQIRLRASAPPTCHIGRANYSAGSLEEETDVVVGENVLNVGTNPTGLSNARNTAPARANNIDSAGNKTSNSDGSIKKPNLQKLFRNTRTSKPRQPPPLETIMSSGETEEHSNSLSQQGSRSRALRRASATKKPNVKATAALGKKSETGKRSSAKSAARSSTSSNTGGPAKQRKTKQENKSSTLMSAASSPSPAGEVEKVEKKITEAAKKELAARESTTSVHVDPPAAAPEVQAIPFAAEESAQPAAPQTAVPPLVHSEYQDWPNCKRLEGSRSSLKIKEPGEQKAPAEQTQKREAAAASLSRKSTQPLLSPPAQVQDTAQKQRRTGGGSSSTIGSAPLTQPPLLSAPAGGGATTTMPASRTTSPWPAATPRDSASQQGVSPRPPQNSVVPGAGGDERHPSVLNGIWTASRVVSERVVSKSPRPDQGRVVSERLISTTQLAPRVVQNSPAVSPRPQLQNPPGGRAEEQSRNSTGGGKNLGVVPPAKTSGTTLPPSPRQPPVVPVLSLPAKKSSLQLPSPRLSASTSPLLQPRMTTTASSGLATGTAGQPPPDHNLQKENYRRLLSYPFDFTHAPPIDVEAPAAPSLTEGEQIATRALTSSAIEEALANHLVQNNNGNDSSLAVQPVLNNSSHHDTTNQTDQFGLMNGRSSASLFGIEPGRESPDLVDHDQITVPGENQNGSAPSGVSSSPNVENNEQEDSVSAQLRRLEQQLQQETGLVKNGVTDADQQDLFQVQCGEHHACDRFRQVVHNVTAKALREYRVNHRVSLRGSLPQALCRPTLRDPRSRDTSVSRSPDFHSSPDLANMPPVPEHE